MIDLACKKYSIRGHEFKVACIETKKCHPSWFTFEDEVEVRERDWQIGEGDVVFDVGASYGSYTLTALAQGAAYVFAWSPQGIPGEPSEAEFLNKSLDWNGWDGNRAAILPGGLWSETGILHEPTQRFFKNECPYQDNYEWIKVRALDEWVDEWTRESPILELLLKAPKIWLKLDVEGAEAHVLHGATKFIRQFGPIIQIENHPEKHLSLPILTASVMDDMGGYYLVHDMPYKSVTHSLYMRNK